LKASLAIRIPGEIAKRWASGVIDDDALFLSPHLGHGSGIYICTLYGATAWRRTVRYLRTLPAESVDVVIFRTDNPVVAFHGAAWGCKVTLDEGTGHKRYMASGGDVRQWLASLNRRG
jgi:hypothetical protein